jgi:2'-5' RNA ligase
MYKFATTLLLATSLIINIHSGVYVLINVPDEISDIVRENQQYMHNAVKEISQNLIFDPAQFSPHLSLAFVSQDDLPFEEIEKKYPELIKKLEEIAQTSSTIDITDNFKKATVAYWDGKFEVDCGGKKKKNYLNVVLKMDNNQKLSTLAQKISEKLKEQYKIEQRFPFSAHITLGRICNQDDKPLGEIKNSLPTQVKIPEKMNAALILGSIKLAGKSEKLFNLSKHPEI